MGSFLSKRLLTVLFLVWLLTAIIFALIASSPQGLERVFSVDGAGPFNIARERSMQNLDSSPAREYFFWLGEIARGNFGTVGGTEGAGFPLSTILWQRLKVSLSLIISSLLFAVTLGLAMGLFSALKPRNLLTRVFNFFNILGVSIPDFALGILLLIVFAVHLRWLPSGGYQGIIIDETGFSYLVDRLRHLILPAITLSFGYIAIFGEHVRNSVSIAMQEDYIRTARSKGLSEKIVVIKHALRNSFIPILASIFSSLPFFLGGIVVVEHLFSWPGLGAFIFRNVVARGGDFYVVLIITGLTSLITLLGSLFADFLYALVDPRVRSPVEKKEKRGGALPLIGAALTCFGAVFLYYYFLEPVYHLLNNITIIAGSFAIFLVLLGSFIVIASPEQVKKKLTSKKAGFFLGVPRFNFQLIWGFLQKFGQPRVIIGLLILVVIIGGHLYLHGLGYREITDVPINIGERLSAPSWENILGTDEMGRSVLKGVLVNAGNTLTLVFYVTLIGVLGGAILGLLSGYVEGPLDRVVMGAFDLLSSVPSFFLVFLVMGAVGSGENVIILAASVVGLIELGRVVRAQMLSVKEYQFVEAAKAIGNSEMQILGRHLLRNVFPLIWGQGLILFGRNMVLLSSLGYLRIIPLPTWGSMAGNAVRTSMYSWWMSVGPIIMIVFVVYAVNAIGKGVFGNIDPLKK